MLFSFPFGPVIIVITHIHFSIISPDALLCESHSLSHTLSRSLWLVFVFFLNFLSLSLSSSPLVYVRLTTHVLNEYDECVSIVCVERVIVLAKGPEVQKSGKGLLTGSVKMATEGIDEK